MGSSSSKHPLNISEVCVEDKQQIFITTPPPFKKVRMLTAYVSPCYPNVPFLICVEYLNQNYKWYKRDDTRGNWKEHHFSDSSPRKAKSEILELFRMVKSNLGISNCHMQTNQAGIRFDITQTPGPGRFFVQYRDDSVANRSVPIFVTKSKETPFPGFFKNSHRPATDNETFVLSRQLQRKGEIGRGRTNKIDGVENVYAYFWDGELTKPILVSVKQDKNLTLYGKGQGGETWSSDQVKDMGEIQALDHQNCRLNNAIPIELTNPTNHKRFQSDKNTSQCLQNRFVSGPRASPLPAGAQTVYEVKAYQVENGRRISRVTYNGNPTNIIPPYNDPGPTLNIYYWNRTYAPLLVEFIKNGQKYDWYENLCIDNEHTKWRKIGENVYDNFYNKMDQYKLTEEFTKKLHEVNCRVNMVVQIDISRKNGSYCHGVTTAHNKRIKVTKETQGKYQGFFGYVHESAVPNQTTFSISSITYYAKPQNIGAIGLPLQNVSKVTVYFPVCIGGVPVAIYIESIQQKRWLKRIKGDDNWEYTNEFINNGGTTQEISKILEKIKTDISACDSSTKPVFQVPPSPPGMSSLSTLDNEPDGKLTFGEIFKDYSNIRDQDGVNFSNNDEHESEDIKKEVADVTFISTTSPTTPTRQHVSHISPVLSSTSSPPGVIIEIYRDDTSPTYRISGEVEIYKTEYPYHSGFYRYTHASTTLTSFEVTRVLYKSQDRDEIKPKGLVDSYSVWYWKEDKGNAQPLLVEMENSDETYTYKYNKGGGTQWNNPNRQSHGVTSEFSDETLETQLDYLNCQLNQAVTMDLSESRKNGQYCCGKVGVDFRSIKIGSSSRLNYYIHSIKGMTDRLSKIKYYVGKDTNRKRINSNELQFPIPAPVDIYVFHCSGKPALIYLDPKGSPSQVNVKGWYKRGKTDETQWERVDNELFGIIPSNMESKCDNFNKLVDVLMTVWCDNLQKCSDAPGSNPSSSSSSVASIPPLDQPLTIQLKHKPSNGRPITYQANTTSGGKTTIEVTRSFYPTDQKSAANFYEYTHTLGPNGGNQPFTLKAVQENETGHIVTGITDVKDVSSVSAYYWTGNTNKVLLVEVLESGKYTYYENDKRGNWKIYNPAKPGEPLTQEQLTNKLILLNCEINDVVQIDVTKTSGYYCHSGHESHIPHDTKKVKVSPAGGNLGNYKALEHVPSIVQFKISGFRMGNDYITLEDLESKLPIKSAKNVLVYFCKNGVAPLLIYVKDTQQWFQRPDNGNVWKLVTNNTPKNENTHKAIVDILDTIESVCQPPIVTIDICKRYPLRKKETYKKDTSSKTIEVKSIQSYHAPGFAEYKLRVHGRNYFTVTDVEYNGENTSGIRVSNPLKNVKSVSIYYWTALEHDSNWKSKSRPLLVKVIVQEHTSTGMTEFYYENISIGFAVNTKWNIWKIGASIGDIQKKLHLLNCYLNNAVVIDVNQKPDGDQAKYYDTCDEKDKSNLDPQHGNDKMKVEKDDPASVGKLEGYTTYTHKLKDSSGGGKFHLVSFKNGSNIMTFNEIGTPILDVEEVKVYFCSKDTPRKPLLIYYTTGTDNKWYKNTDGGIPGNWIPAGDGLSTSDGTNQYEKILNVLKTLDSKCKSDTPETAEKFVLESTGAVATGMTLGSILGTSSGTLAGAGGLTGLGWWAFKRTKGDPWVRQI